MSKNKLLGTVVILFAIIVFLFYYLQYPLLFDAFISNYAVKYFPFPLP